jgi:NAD(P)H-hydrate epimerase
MLKKVITGLEIQKLDSIVIKEIGIPAEVLMERAGVGVYEKLVENYPLERYKKVLVICGPGNNGGDGMVCARHLKSRGYNVKLILLCEEEKYKGEAKLNLEIAKKLNLPIQKIKDSSELFKVLEEEKPDVLVDAIFGTGLKRKIEGFFAEVINLINGYKEREKAKIVAVDIPSGVCSNTGRVLGTAVKADLTVSFELIKVGHVFYPGKEYTGKLEIVPISFPADIVKKEAPERYYIEDCWAKAVFKKREGYVHKGSFGHVMVLAGSRGKSGAGFLTGLGALRGGAGLVTLASTKTLQNVYAVMLPEALTLGLEENFYGEVSIKELPKIVEACSKKSVLVIGPGLGLSTEMKILFFELLKEINLPLVIDADALTLLSEKPEVLKDYPGFKILTPHPGEAIRILKISKEELMEDRIFWTKRLSELTGAVVILKGAHSVICGDGKEGISSIDEPGLSQGGTGDVLAGLIGALVAQGYDPFTSACLGVFVHGKAGKILSKEYGPFGYPASLLAETFPSVFKILQEEI